MKSSIKQFLFVVVMSPFLTCLVLKSKALDKDEVRPDSYAFKKVYNERWNRVEQTCVKYGLMKDSNPEEELINDYQDQQRRYDRPLTKTLLYNANHHLTYCWVHKVASSSWNKVFFQLVGKKNVGKKNLHKAAQLLNPQTESQLHKALSNDSIKFFFVRHPFERIVSAFVDKFEQGVKSNYVFKNFGKQVNKVNGQRIDHVPTFAEFVNYLIQTPPELYNDHWIPFWLHCHLCSQTYNIVGTLETLQEDSDFIAAAANLKNLTFPWENKLKLESKTKLIYQSYFNDLDRDAIIKLHNIYRIDFEMFDFSAKSYASYLP